MTTTTTSGSTETHTIIDVRPEELEAWLAAGEAVVVDVREDFEHASERIEGSHHMALGRLDPGALREAHPDHRIVLHCRSGKRSEEAARRLAAHHGAPAHHLAGGIEAWKASGRTVHRSASAPRLDVMRQVQVTAGSLVLVGVLLGWLVTPAFVGLSAFVGAGLVFAGLSGWCGLARLLARMPWNRGAPAG